MTTTDDSSVEPTDEPTAMPEDPTPGVTIVDTSMALTDFSLDEQQNSLSDVFHNTVTRLRGGDLGSLPAILAIVVLVAIFGIARPDSFLSLLNFANFLDQASSVIVIAMAVTFVLLLGDIDLAAGFTAGVSAAVLATRLADGWPLVPSLLASFGVALLLGVFTGFLVAKVGIPSFVVTLANVLLFQGILLLIVKDGGSVRIQNDFINDIVGGTLDAHASRGSWPSSVLRCTPSPRSAASARRTVRSRCRSWRSASGWRSSVVGRDDVPAQREPGVRLGTPADHRDADRDPDDRHPHGAADLRAEPAAVRPLPATPSAATARRPDVPASTCSASSGRPSSARRSSPPSVASSSRHA